MARSSLFLTGPLLLATGSVALAADIIAYEPPVVVAPVVIAPYDWSGAYIGGTIGYVFEDATEVSASTPGAGLFSERYIGDTDGIIGGVFGGYGISYNSFVLGVEGDFEFADVEGSRETFGGGALTAMKLDKQASVRARLGYAIDRALVYATGGVAFGDLDYAAADASGAAGYSDWEVGYTVGGGAQYAVTDAIFARAEYRFTDYGSETISTPGADYDFDTRTHAINVGVGYKF